MSTAVVYTGEVRTFAKVFDNQYWHLLRHLQDPVFYAVVADDAQAEDLPRCLRTRFPAAAINFVKLPQPDLPAPPASGTFQGYPNSVPAQSILRQLWFLNQVRLDAPTYPIVRIRPDIAFLRFEMPEQGQTPYCISPWWGRWGGINDRLAFLHPTGAKEYFSTYLKIGRLMSLGCPFHPETLIDASLRDAGLHPTHTLATEFVTVRLDGSVRAAEISNTDIVEYARSRRDQSP